MGIIVLIVGMTENEILTKIEVYSKAEGIAPATATRRAVGNSRLYTQLKSGKTITVRVANQLLDYFENGVKADIK